MGLARPPLPDWIIQAILTDPGDVWQVFKQMGVAELAACLGPVKRYDRRGDVFFLDSFEYGFGRWTSEVSGTDAEVVLSSGTARTGGLCVNLVGGKDTLEFAGLLATFAPVSLGKLGVELSFNIYVEVQYVDLYLIYYDGTNDLQGGLRYNPVAKTLSYLIGDDEWTELDTAIETPYIKGAFFTTKLVVDFDSQEYVRVLFNEEKFDLSGIGIYTPVDHTGPYLAVRIRVTSVSGENGRCWIDDVILTQNEPS